MNVPAKLAAFAAVLAVAFGGAALAGAAIDPTEADQTAGAAHGGSERTGGEGHGEPAGGHGQAADAHGEAADAAPGGLAVSEGGYTLEPDRTTFAAGEPARFSFHISDARARAVRDFELEHERELHLIVVSRDTATYRHLHPRKSPDGTWSVELSLPEPGAYRAYADFTVGGERHTLAADLVVPGELTPQPFPVPATADEDAGYDVELRADHPEAGSEGELTFAVTRDGEPVEALQDYLGAKGHLVALREGDLAYLHVHPTDAGANEVPFAATFPSAGRYRLFFQFKTDGRVRTVDYTLEVPR